MCHLLSAPTHTPQHAALPARFPYLLVDEYQDCNQLQIDIVSALQQGRNGHGSVTVVGDDRQCSCCSWLQIVRGSDVLNSEVVRGLLAHLRTGISPHDDEAFEAASRGPPRRLGDAFWQGLREAREALFSTEGKVRGAGLVGGVAVLVVALGRAAQR